jgi:hypothetical protein
MNPRQKTLSPPYLIGIAAFFLLLLLGLYAYRNVIFQSLQDPGVPFQTYEKPPQPDYTQDRAWLSRPDISKDSFLAKAPGDAFVVVPGVYRGGKHWVLPVDVERRRERLQRIVRPNYVAPYGYAGRLFAPYYRHAAMYSYMTNREDAQRARDFAYGDVRRAFEQFLTDSPPERPIILAGHGQGADHVIRLMADYFQGDLKNRLAAAYVIDHPLPISLFDGPLSALAPCEAANDFGCVAAFGTFMPSDSKNAERFSSKASSFNGRRYMSINGAATLCINPLLWTRSEDYAVPRLHLGGLAGEGLEPDNLPAPLPRQTGAQCQDGLLLVDKPRSRSLRRPWGLGARFWTLPSNLFFEDLRVNARLRTQALIETGRLPTRVRALDSLDVIDIIESPVTPYTGQNPKADNLKNKNTP